jgi:DNA (cytosine-5)-methyltransferase 1
VLRHVDLCSGIGGFALGFEWAGLSKPVLFCDIESWSRKVLAKHWPDVPIAHDVKVLANDPTRLVPDCDILTAGYPCQPFSVAGQQRGAEDDRHIWPFISQIIAQKRPAWCVLENVYGHVGLGLDEVLADLEAQDYATRAFIVPACAVNAPHRRDRLWIIARNVGNTAHNGCSGWGEANGREGKTHQLQQQSGIRGESIGSGENVADTMCEGLQGHTNANRQRLGQSGRQQITDQSFSRRKENPAKDWWAVEPAMGRVAHGLPKKLDRFDGWEREPADIPRVATGVKDRISRLKGLGNAIVPSIAMQIGLTIKAVRDA